MIDDRRQTIQERGQHMPAGNIGKRGRKLWVEVTVSLTRQQPVSIQRLLAKQETLIQGSRPVRMMFA